MIDYRQNIAKKIATIIDPSVKFNMDMSNNILIPYDENSCKVYLIANSIVDHLHEVLELNVHDITEIYTCIFDKYKELSSNVDTFLVLLRILGVDHKELERVTRETRSDHLL